MMLGIGSGAMIMPSFAQQLIAKFGWRAAYAILGLAVLLISVPVVGAFLKEKPQDLSRRSANREFYRRWRSCASGSKRI
jgi:hypothetical protein